MAAAKPCQIAGSTPASNGRVYVLSVFLVNIIIIKTAQGIQSVPRSEAEHRCGVNPCHLPTAHHTVLYVAAAAMYSAPHPSMAWSLRTKETNQSLRSANLGLARTDISGARWR
jgi:hypothetical protein